MHYFKSIGSLKCRHIKVYICGLHKFLDSFLACHYSGKSGNDHSTDKGKASNPSTPSPASHTRWKKPAPFLAFASPPHFIFTSLVYTNQYAPTFRGYWICFVVFNHRQIVSHKQVVLYRTLMLSFLWATEAQLSQWGVTLFAPFYFLLFLHIELLYGVHKFNISGTASRSAAKFYLVQPTGHTTSYFFLVTFNWYQLIYTAADSPLNSLWIDLTPIASLVKSET